MLGRIETWDLLALRALYGGHTQGPGLQVMIALTLLGSGWNMVCLLPLLVTRRTRRAVSALVGALLVVAVAVFLLKHVVGRIRPCMALEAVDGLWNPPRDFSFPSGHSAGSFAVAAFCSTLLLGREKRPTWAMVASLSLFALAAAVGVSRVYLGVHYPTDVIGGALLGSLLGSVAAVGHTRRVRIDDSSPGMRGGGEEHRQRTRAPPVDEGTHQLSSSMPCARQKRCTVPDSAR